VLEIGLLSAFIAGLLAFISPCILPLIPVYIGFMSSETIYKDEKIKISERLRLLLNSTFFVIGFSIIFIILGSTVTFIGRALTSYLSIIGRVGGVLLIIFGLHYIGLFKIRFLNMEKRFNIPAVARQGYLRSFLIGVTFSFGWIPCVGLILSGILLLASKMETLIEGISLLGIFSLGLGLPFILASIFLSFFSNFFKKINKHLNIIKIISGMFLIALGIVFVTDSMIRVVGYLSKYIPILDKISF
jgi:cytochrome c-type biogenesis protein